MRACACGPCGYDAHIHVCGWCARGRDCVYPSYLNCIAKMIDIRCTLRVEMFPILCDDFLLRFDRGFGSAVNGFASARRPPLRSRARTSPVHKSPHKYLAASARASPRSERGRGGGEGCHFLWHRSPSPRASSGERGRPGHSVSIYQVHFWLMKRCGRRAAALGGGRPHCRFPLFFFFLSAE